MVGVGGTVGQEKEGEREMGGEIGRPWDTCGTCTPGIQKIEGFGWLEQYIDLRHKKRRQKFLMALEQAAHLGDADAQNAHPFLYLHPVHVYIKIYVCTNSIFKIIFNVRVHLVDRSTVDK